MWMDAVRDLLPAGPCYSQAGEHNRGRNVPQNLEPTTYCTLADFLSGPTTRGSRYGKTHVEEPEYCKCWVWLKRWLASCNNRATI